MQVDEVKVLKSCDIKAGDEMQTVLKYPGSKWSTAEWIISFFPEGYEKMTYLDPYFGSGAVFFKKRRSAIETINDIDGRVVNLFRQIREKPEEFAQLIEFTPWARDEYKGSYEKSDDPLEDARRFTVRCWQAIGTKTSDISGWSNNIKPGDSGISRWHRLNQTILQVAKRLSNEKLQLVQIENQPAIKLIERYNRKETLIYCDPPYLLSTRSGRIYEHEMTEADHYELMHVLLKHKGKVVLSGYDNHLYNSILEGWHKETMKATTEMGGSSTEVIWMNYEPPIMQLKMTI